MTQVILEITRILNVDLWQFSDNNCGFQRNLYETMSFDWRQSAEEFEQLLEISNFPSAISQYPKNSYMEYYNCRLVERRRQAEDISEALFTVLLLVIFTTSVQVLKKQLTKLSQAMVGIHAITHNRSAWGFHQREMYLSEFQDILLRRYEFIQALERSTYLIAANEKQIESLPVLKPDDAGSCAICLSAYEKDDNIIKLNCDHYFHQNCLTKWLRIKSICPYCRKSAFDNQ